MTITGWTIIATLALAIAFELGRIYERRLTRMRLELAYEQGMIAGRKIAAAQARELAEEVAREFEKA